MDNLKNEHLTESQQREILKNAITILVENYKNLLISNNKITNLEKQKFYNELEHNIAIIEFITKCNLDDGALWDGSKIMDNNDSRY